jgi:hypothetical protein
VWCVVVRWVMVKGYYYGGRMGPVYETQHSSSTQKPTPRPETLPTCRRKKDHGRAEALLLVAWALGIRVPAASKTAESLAVMAKIQTEP